MNMREAPKDRISSLPDPLLHHILSFLEAKDGARTSVLSHRWNCIWTTVPELDFESVKFILDPSETERFMDFVDGTLHRHKLSNVENFFLGSDSHLNESRVHSWISNVVSGNLKKIGLYLSQRQPLFIPLSLFTCESLTFLRLGGYPSIRLPKYISFPRLKCLKLYEFEISNECWNGELFSNSTVLEELVLEHCIYHTKNFCISIPTLKHLRFDTWTNEENDLRDCVFKIDAPRLVTFIYSNYLAKDFVLSSFPELVEADVYFNTEETDRAEAISRLLCALAHVKCLTVCEETLQAICSTSYLSNKLVTFRNVKMLKISESLTTDKGLIALLKAAPNLESLVFVESMDDEVKEDRGEEDENDSDKDDDNDSYNEDEDDNADSVEGENNRKNDEGDVADAVVCGSNDVCENNLDNEDDSWALNIATAGSLFPHLKSVCFEQFYGNRREMKWMRLILRDAKALQMVTIRYYDKLHFANSKRVSKKTEKELMVEIPSFPRASSGCLFKFGSSHC